MQPHNEWPDESTQNQHEYKFNVFSSSWDVLVSNAYFPLNIKYRMNLISLKILLVLTSLALATTMPRMKKNNDKQKK